MSYIVTGKEIPQGCVTCTHGKFTESHILYCEFLMQEPKVKISRPDWCPLEECKRGKWEFVKGDGTNNSDGWKCSACARTYHTRVPYFDEFEYCPNCGAKMEGDKNDEHYNSRNGDANKLHSLPIQTT